VSSLSNLTLPNFNKDIVIILVNQSASPTVNRKPDAFLTSPISGTGTGQVNSVTVSANAVCADDAAVSCVKFWADYNDGSGKAWRLLNTDYTAPYSYQWDISSVPDQTTVEFRLDVNDSKGVSRTSAMGLYNKGGITLEHSGGDVTGGYGSIEFPPQDAIINTAKTVTLKARAWDISSGVKKVRFWIQGTPGNPYSSTNTLLGEVYTPTSGVYKLDVNLSGYINSTRWISIDVVDNNGNTVAAADLHDALLWAWPDVQAVLLHRYSFTNGGGLIAVDSIGGRNGTLGGGATISGNAVLLNGTSSYVKLPGGLITGLTALSFEAWFTCSADSGMWTRVWDFGNTDWGDWWGSGCNYVFFAPKTGLGTFRYAISDADPGFNHENYVDAAPTPTDVPVYVACVQDDFDGTVKLYVDGLLVSSGKFSIPLSSVNNVFSYLGRSTYFWDPLMKGSIDEFRIYDSTLTAEEVAEHYSAGPDAIGNFPVVIQEAGGSTEVIEGDITGDEYTVALSSQPTNTVTLTVDPDEQLDIGNGCGNPVNIVFNTNNWNSAQTVVVRAFDDDVLEADPHIGLIKHSVSSSDPAFNNKPLPSVGVKIWDNECGAWGYNYSDLNYDCQVNFKDFAIFASYWLSSLNPITLDTFVSEWLETTQPYAPNAQYGPVQYPP
jgi:hypothetical protein